MRGRMPGLGRRDGAVMRSPAGCAGGARSLGRGEGEEDVVEAGAPQRRRCPRRPTRRARRARGAGPTTVPSVGTSRSSSPCVRRAARRSRRRCRALSSSGVPVATMRPPSSTAMRSASRSASSRYWVVRSTVVPASASDADDVPQLAAAARVESRRRLVEEQHARGDDEAERQVEAPAHAARVGADALGRGIRQPEALEQLRGARLRAARGTRPESRPSMTRFSAPVSTSSTAADWPVRLMRCLTSSGSRDDVEAGDRRACPRRGGRASSGC